MSETASAPIAADGPQQPPRFLVALALAWAGGAIAYTPFLTLLLPIRFTELSPTEDAYWLALAATLGAVAAGLSNILWGWASDRLGSRRQWIAIGLMLTAMACVLIVRAETPPQLIAAIVGWQIALNMLLAPIGAYAADSVPDSQKGRLGGWLSVGPAMAALSLLAIAVVPERLSDQLALVMATVALCVLPLLLLRRALPLGRERMEAARAAQEPVDRATLLRLWIARLLVQVAEGLLFLFVYYFLREVSGGQLSVARYALTNAIVHAVAIPVALGVGRWSDRTGRRRLPLMAMTIFMASGLGGMAMSESYALVVMFYGIFLVGSNSFLALHSAFAMQKLPNPDRYGRDLGFFNLTNTLPSLTTPLLAVLVIGAVGYSGLLAGLAAVMLLPALILNRARFR